MLQHDVHDFIENGANPQILDSLLQRCMDDGGKNAMTFVGQLFEDDYGGMTYKWELKEPAGFALLFWGKQGLDELARMAAGNGRFSNFSIVFDILSSAAAGEFSSFLIGNTSSRLKTRLVSSGCFSSEMRKQAARTLVEIVLRIEDDEDVLNPLAHVFQRHYLKPNGLAAARSMLQAISSRWFALGDSTLTEYQRLIDVDCH